MNFWLVRNKFRQNPAETERVFAERRSYPVIPCGRRVALVKDEVNDFEYRRQTRCALRPARHLERDTRRTERPLGPHDSLRDRRLRHEEGARDSLGGQTSQ